MAWTGLARQHETTSVDAWVSTHERDTGSPRARRRSLRLPRQAFERLERRRDRRRRNRGSPPARRGSPSSPPSCSPWLARPGPTPLPDPASPHRARPRRSASSSPGNPILRANEVVVNDHGSIEAVDLETRDPSDPRRLRGSLRLLLGGGRLGRRRLARVHDRDVPRRAAVRGGRRPLGRERSWGTPSTDPELRSGPVLPAGVGMVADERHARGRRTRRRSVGPAVAVPGRSGDGWPNRDRGSAHGRRDARVVPRRIAIAYAGAGNVYIAPLDGGAPTLLAEGSAPRWSPDGNHVASRYQDRISVVPPTGRTRSGSRTATRRRGRRTAFTS